MVEIKTLSFDQQVEALLERGLPMGREALLDAAAEARPADTPERSVLTLSRAVLPLAEAVAGIERRGRTAVLGHLEPEELEGFVPIDAVQLPEGPSYLAVDVDLGAATRNVPPETALQQILAAGRSPLTLDEGIALMLQQPEAIATNWGFSMAGSRRDDQRVTAFWVSDRRPKLGWCWDRNPHTWLATASCARRVSRAAPA
jgi:hypothetical protein